MTLAPTPAKMVLHAGPRQISDPGRPVTISTVGREGLHANQSAAAQMSPVACHEQMRTELQAI